MISFSQAMQRIVERQSLTEEEMVTLMRLMMSGGATPAQIGGLLTGLAVKGESTDELVGAVRVMREMAVAVDVSTQSLVDTCGTGGDGSRTFNISTAAALVVAAAGGRVAKHGNRAVSSRSGSADVLEAAGVCLDLQPEQLARCIDTLGVAFLFAPMHHKATHYVASIRRELGVRTLFNLLGPMTNPARAPFQVLGVYAMRWLRPVAEVLQRLGSQRVMVLHSEDGMDEVSLSAPTGIVELKAGVLKEYSVTPETFGMVRADRQCLEVQSVSESLEKMRLGLSDRGGALSDIVALNAGASLYISGCCGSWQQGVQLAQDVQAGGQALEKLRALVDFTQACVRTD